MAFIYGILAGALTTLLGFGLFALLPESSSWAAPAQLREIAEASWQWAWQNLGYSLWAFAAVLTLYLRALERLREALASEAAPERVAQAEQLVDVWTSLFFGIGVIWTAIGMRSALIHGLGDPGAAYAGDAAHVLARLVDGGILLALSTTIFGGIGGYLMRVAKVVTVGTDLRRYYDHAARASSSSIEAAVIDIQRRLAILAQRRSDTGVRDDDEVTLGARPHASDA
jgi:hypothetical protein